MWSRRSGGFEILSRNDYRICRPEYEFAGTDRDAAEWIQSFVKKKVSKIDG